MFIDKFKFRQNVCNGCHYLLMIYINLSDVSIFNIKDADYRCNISGVNKSDATILSKNRFDQKKQNVIKHKFYYHI